jgi:hypothetical protein
VEIACETAFQCLEPLWLPCDQLLLKSSFSGGADRDEVALILATDVSDRYGNFAGGDLRRVELSPPIPNRVERAVVPESALVHAQSVPVLVMRELVSLSMPSPLSRLSRFSQLLPGLGRRRATVSRRHERSRRRRRSPYR